MVAGVTSIPVLLHSRVMETHISSAAALRPFKGKGHDRIVSDSTRGVFAVFDGAANAEASSLAASCLEELLESGVRLDVRHSFTEIQRRLVATYQSAKLTTGSIVSLYHHDQQNIQVRYAAAGDSPIMYFNPVSQQLEQWTQDESVRHETYIDASNFLGSSRHRLRQLGKRAVHRGSTLLMMSDGITDEYFDGHLKPDDITSAILSTTSAEELADQILNDTAVFDDASVVAIRFG